MPLRPLLCLVPAAAITANAQWHAAGSVDSVRTDSKRQVTLFAGNSTLTLSVMTDDMIRVLIRPATSQTPDRSWAVVKPEWPAPEVTLRDGDFFERSHRVRSWGSGEVLTITKAEGSYVPPSRKVLVCFAGLSGKPLSVSVNGRKTSQWTYDDAKRIATVVPPDSRDEMEVGIVR
jgi:hypothetical protein